MSAKRDGRYLWWTVGVLGAAVISLAGCETSLRCGAGTVQSGPSCVPEETLLQPQVKSLELTRLELEPAGVPLHLTYPLHVQGTLSIAAEELETELQIGLDSASAGTGCVVGGFPFAHQPSAETPDAAVAHELDQELRIPAACAALVGRTDLTAFVAFDPFRQTGVVGRPGAETPPPAGETADAPDAEGVEGSSYELAKGSVIAPAAACVGCATQHELRGSPGRDIELREVSLASSVAVLELGRNELPAQTPQEIIDRNSMLGFEIPTLGELTAEPAQLAPKSGEPHFMVTAAYRAHGLDLEEKLADGQIAYTAEIRPLPGGVHVETIPDDERDWQPLTTTGTGAGAGTANDPIPAPKGDADASMVASFYIDGTALSRMDVGSWSEVTEFEVRFCLTAAFPEAVFEGETAPRANNCTQGSVTVVRKIVTPAGAETLAPNDGLATSWERQLGWLKNWGAKKSAFAELAFWLTMGFSSSAGTTNFGLGGSSITGKGGWYEAGARATACVLNGCVDLARAQVTMKDYQGSADTFFMEGRILIFDFLPRVFLAWPDGKLTLKQVLTLISNAKGKDYSSVKSFEKEIIGKKFNIPVINKTIEASVKAFVDLGLDDGDTAIEKTALGPEPDPCLGRPTSDGQCYAVASRQWVSPATLSVACKAQFGEESWPAIVRSPQDLDALVAAADTKQPVLTGHLYTQNKIGAGATVKLWTGPSDFFVPQLYNPWIPSQPNNDNPGKTQLVAYGTVSDFGTGFYSAPLPATVRYGMCGIRQRPPTLGGSKITVTVVPFVAAGVRATVKANLGALSAFAEGTLNIVKAGVEFLGSLAGRFREDQKVSIEIGRSITLTVSLLSGSIDVGARLNFKAPCVPKFWKKCNYSIRGSINILSWGGFKFAIPILPFEKATLVL